ncbi:hypothetical protein TNCV_4765311 [Trichonephila clavipes]|nr:hypothetical protein TNCV_4765311 [Trichonephila clavipes]
MLKVIKDDDIFYFKTSYGSPTWEEAKKRNKRGNGSMNPVLVQAYSKRLTTDEKKKEAIGLLEAGQSDTTVVIVSRGRWCGVSRRSLDIRIRVLLPLDVGGHQTCLSINRLWHELCDMLPSCWNHSSDIMIVQFRNEKVSNHGSIPITIDSNVGAFIVFEEGFHQPHKAHQTVSFSGCNGVSTYTCGLASLKCGSFVC